MTRNMIIWIWLTAFLHPVIFPCVLHTAMRIDTYVRPASTEEDMIRLGTVAILK